jgi:hypothetical protein
MLNRKHLNAEALIGSLKKSFSKINDPRSKNSQISFSDYIMSGFALFSQKKPSLLAFDEGRNNEVFSHNMKNLYGIDQIPSDTRMREVLDLISPDDLRPAFTDIFSKFQRGKCLDRFKFLEGKYLVALDGTGFFSSDSIHCVNCMVKESKKTCQKTYYHQMMAGVIIHPDVKEVIPLCPEPILKQDGSEKNDCERNAVARWLDKFQGEHPKIPVIITEDGLSSNGPHIKKIIELGYSYILMAKPGDHKYLFENFHLSAADVKSYSIIDGSTEHQFRYINRIALNEKNSDLMVNFLEYKEDGANGVKTFTWVTDIEINNQNVYQIMSGGRARWKIENETFNTLKNQGYEFEHNFGHGNKNLSTNFAFLMMLAFLIDQIQQSISPAFQAALAASKRKTRFWERIRSWFDEVFIPNWEAFFLALASRIGLQFPNSS